jgi:hypothetical protein
MQHYEVEFDEKRNADSATGCWGERGDSEAAALCGTMRYICRAAEAVDWGWGWGWHTRLRWEFGMTTGRTENHGWQVWVHTTLGWCT